MRLRHESAPGSHLAPVHGEDAVADAEAGGLRGGVRLDLADDGAVELQVVADFGRHRPDEQRERQAEHHVAERAADADDDALPPGRGLEVAQRRLVAPALDRLHPGRIELGQRDVAAKGNPADLVLRALDSTLPNRRTEAQGECVDDQSGEARGEEVAQFVNEDREAEEQQHGDRRAGPDEPSGQIVEYRCRHDERCPSPTWAKRISRLYQSAPLLATS